MRENIKNKLLSYHKFVWKKRRNIQKDFQTLTSTQTDNAMAKYVLKETQQYMKHNIEYHRLKNTNSTK